MGGLPSVIKSSTCSPSLPSLMLTNANHILNKLDELSIRSALGNFDIICITESWLNDDIRDDVCSLPN